MLRFLVLSLLVLSWSIPPAAAACPPPPEGLWFFRAFEPVINFFQEQGKAYGQLSKSTTENVYTGLFYGQSTILPGTVKSIITFVFDPEACLMYGTNIVPFPSGPGAHDTILLRWNAKEKQMQGLFSIIVAGKINMYPYHSMYLFDYVGPWDERHPGGDSRRFLSGRG